MVWSLSQDDDGLEGLGSSPQAVAAGFASRAARPVAPNSSTAHSVVVDPVSQIPEALPSRPSSPRSTRRGGETTLVLRDRKLDALRAEVKRRQTEFQRRRVSALVIWAAAGGIAVFVGATLARGWEGWTGDQNEGALAAANPQAVEAPVAGGEPTPSALATTPTASVISAPSAPVVHAEPQSPRALAEEPADPQRATLKSAKVSTSNQKRALSLDELPTK